jgi:hypothetical protein
MPVAKTELPAEARRGGMLQDAFEQNVMRHGVSVTMEQSSLES